MRTVIKIGGSLLYEDNSQAAVERIVQYAQVLRELHRAGHLLVIVVGGGRPARTFISAARALGANETQSDWLGIKIARHNAELLIIALGDVAFPRVIDNLEELEVALCTGRIVLMGGLTPGQSTNAVAALAAETIRADKLLNATNVDGIYDRDPRQADAKRLSKVHITEFERILSNTGSRAGEYDLFDPVAVRIIKRSRIATIIFDGRDPNNLRLLFEGTSVGSVVTYE